MASLSTTGRRILYGSAAGLAVLAGLVVLTWDTDYDIYRAANDILLQGNVTQNCVINVSADSAASNLPLSVPGTQRIQVGTVTQSCNRRIGYTLAVTSLNCAGQPNGAKLIGPGPGDFLSYSGEFNNPTTGGSAATVTGLLQTACVGQFGREVTNAKVTNEISTVFVNFTGDASLTAGAYQDTFTITMNVK